MSEREIPPEDWASFLQQFSRDHRAWLATVERVPRGAPSYHVAAAERPLGSVTADVIDGRIAGIAIQFQGESPGDVVRIAAPRRLRVEETGEGRARLLEIENSEGDWMRIRFRAAPPLEALDGVAPGEA